MNTKMKKVVAGVVLGTFTLGVASPAFASSNELYAEAQAVINTQAVRDMALYHGEAEPGIETYGIKGITLKALKNAIDGVWTKVTTFLVTYNIEIEMLDNLGQLKTRFFEAMDALFDVCDTVNDLLVQSFMKIGFSRSNAQLVADFICLLVL